MSENITCKEWEKKVRDRKLPADFEELTDPKERTKIGDWYYSPFFGDWFDDASFMFGTSPIPHHDFKAGYRLGRKVTSDCEGCGNPFCECKP